MSGAHDAGLHPLFFAAFRDRDDIVVMAAHQVDSDHFTVPGNFIVRDYVPQHAIQARTTAATTHCGLNSLNDLIGHEVPFFAWPLGADQPLLAARAEALSAAVVLDAATVTALQLRTAVDYVIDDPRIHTGIRWINASFTTGDGLGATVDAILALPVQSTHERFL